MMMVWRGNSQQHGMDSDAFGSASRGKSLIARHPRSVRGPHKSALGDAKCLVPVLPARRGILYHTLLYLKVLICSKIPTALPTADLLCKIDGNIWIKHSSDSLRHRGRCRPKVISFTGQK